MNVERLGKENYDEIIGLMNAVFSRQRGREVDFERDLPKMCVRDDEHMRKHFGIFENGRLVACLGVYPFETMVGDEKLSFSTMGNLVTHWDYEGRGYMSAMIDRAMHEMEELNVDVARLGGLRSRYNRYGFEACGQKYSFTFTAKNRERKFPCAPTDIEFAEIRGEDIETLRFATKLYNANGISVTRTVETAYLSMTAWRNIPYVAIRNGEKIGYISANETGINIAECFAITTQAFVDMLCAWQKRQGADIRFSLQPHQIDKIRIFSAVCESSSITSPSHFYIRNWERIVNAFIKLKAGYSELPQGELKIGIENYGSICVYVKGGEAGCKKTEEQADITLDRLAASRYIFGPYSPVYTEKSDVLANSWFPLPLGWNGQDRV